MAVKRNFTQTLGEPTPLRDSFLVQVDCFQKSYHNWAFRKFRNGQRVVECFLPIIIEVLRGRWLFSKSDI